MDLDNKPLVSILIPFYNHNHFIKETLDSIIEDTYPNKEIIIINDGSSNPDDSNITTWIKKNKNNISIQYIKRENKGVSKTFNELVELAKGDYILPCSSDDYLINNTINKRIKTLQSNPDKLLLISDNIVIDDSGKKIYDSNLFELHNSNKMDYFTDDGLKNIVINEWSFAGPTWIADKKLFKFIGPPFDEKLIVEDWDFFLRIISQNLALFYDEKVSAYRIHDTNVSGDVNKRLQMHKDIYKTLIKNSTLFEDKYKKQLLLLSKEYKKRILDEENMSLLKKIRIRTKSFRYKIKTFFKSK